MGRSDAELVAGILRRDDNAFDELFARHAEAARRHLERIVRDRSVADDLTQELFLRVWTRAEQWEGRGPLVAWIRRVATNLALKHLRSVGRRKERPLAPAPPDREDEEEWHVPGWMIDDATVRANDAFDLDERRRYLHRLVAGLSEEHREVIRLVFDEDLDIRGAAAALGIPEGTVKSRLHYAKKRLAREWDYED